MSTESLAASDVKMLLDEEGETVSYFELGEGLAVVFNAIVDRRPVELQEVEAIGSDSALAYKGTRFALYLPVDLTLAAVTITRNSDTVQLKKNLGDAADTTFKVITDPQVSGGFRRILIAA